MVGGFTGFAEIGGFIDRLDFPFGKIEKFRIVHLVFVKVPILILKIPIRRLGRNRIRRWRKRPMRLRRCPEMLELVALAWFLPHDMNDHIAKSIRTHSPTD